MRFLKDIYYFILYKGRVKQAAYKYYKYVTFQTNTKELKYYNKAIDLDPNNWLYHYAKGIFLGNIEGMKCLNKALELSPKEVEHEHIWNRKGDILVSIHKYEEALECYNNAININLHAQDIEEALIAKGKLLKFLGRKKEALNCLEKALNNWDKYTKSWAKETEENPNKTPYIWIEKGDLYFSLERFEEATNCYDKAINIESRDHFAWYKKAIALEKIGTEESLTDAKYCIEEVLCIKEQYWDTKGDLPDVSKVKRRINRKLKKISS